MFDSTNYEVPVRCRAGHLFTTVWVPAVSFKAVRLGRSRYQWCPVGRHFSLVRPVAVDELDERERELAASRHDTRVP